MEGWGKGSNYHPFLELQLPLGAQESTHSELGSPGQVSEANKNTDPEAQSWKGEMQSRTQRPPQRHRLRPLQSALRLGSPQTHLLHPPPQPHAQVSTRVVQGRLPALPGDDPTSAVT